MRDVAEDLFLVKRHDAQVMSHRPPDWRMKYRVHLRNLWNYGRDPVLQRMQHDIETNAVPDMILLTGPKTVGKTTLGLTFGMWAACLRWREFTMPCGECIPCKCVLNGESQFSAGYFELDCTSLDFERHFKEALLCASGASKGLIIGPHTDNPRPCVVFLDEAHRLPGELSNTVIRGFKYHHGDAIAVLAATQTDKLHPIIVDRATRYELNFPTYEEAAAGLMRVANLENMRLDRKAALRIAKWAAGKPRNCLEVLEHLQMWGTDIGVGIVDEYLGRSPESVLNLNDSDTDVPTQY